MFYKLMTSNDFLRKVAVVKGLDYENLENQCLQLFQTDCFRKAHQYQLKEGRTPQD